MIASPDNVAALLYQTGLVSHYWQKLVDPTFRGLYQVNAFDLAIMLPYFFVMTILAMYGIHRYHLVYNFFRNRKNVPGPPPEWPCRRGRR